MAIMIMMVLMMTIQMITYMYLLHRNFLQVRYLQQHDELARQIAQNGHNFALSYLRYGDNIFF